MADEPRDQDELVDSPDASETREGEHERVRSSNDRDQEMERVERGPLVVDAGAPQRFQSASRLVVLARPELFPEEIGRQVEYRPVETDGATRAATRIAELL